MAYAAGTCGMVQGDHIKPAWGPVTMALQHPCLCRAAHAAQFGWGKRGLGPAIQMGISGADLHKHQHTIIASYDVDLSNFLVREIAVHDLISLIGEEVCRVLFGRATSFYSIHEKTFDIRAL